jgi:hypothetical protein
VSNCIDTEYLESTIQNYGDLDRKMKEIRSTIVSFFAAAGVTLPVRQYTTTGGDATVAYDCEQLTVTVAQIYLGTPGEPSYQPTGCMLNMSGDFIIELVRCAPIAAPSKRNPDKIAIPTVEEMQAATLIRAIDAQILLEAAHAVPSTQGVVASIEFAGADGAMQAIIMRLACSLV